MTKAKDTAYLSNEGAYTLFSFGDKCIKFHAPYSLVKYLKVNEWNRGYLAVDTQYTTGVEEEYIDLRAVLPMLMIRPDRFLKPIKKVEVRYA